MSKPSGSKASRLSAAERQLEREQAEIMNRQRELEARLKHIPLQLEAREEEQRAQAKRRAAAAGPAISPNFGRNATATRRGRGRNRSLRTPSRERMLAKLKTFGWLIILAIIVFMLYRVIPS